MSQEPYKTESLDLAAWLMAYDLELVGVEEISHGRHQWQLGDPEGTARDLSTKFANSIAADVLDNRKRLITIARSGKPKPGRKG